MSATNVVEGQTVKVDVQLIGGETNLYPQAELLDSSNSPIAESPLALTHVSGGLYSGTFVMPATEKVTSRTRIYTDAGFTTESSEYGPSIDEFVSFEAQLTINNYGNTDLEGELDDTGELIGAVEDC